MSEHHKRENSYFPSSEYRYWLYDPEGDGMVYFNSVAARDKNAESCVQGYLDYAWDETVENIACGEVTHFAQCLNKQLRPDDIDEDGCDEEGIYWPEEMAWRGNYKMEPISTIQDSEAIRQKNRADALAATIRALQDIVTHDFETKADFIARVRAALGDDPDERLMQQPEPHALTCHISADDPRYPTLVIQGDFGSVGYAINPATGELARYGQ